MGGLISTQHACIIHTHIHAYVCMDIRMYAYIHTHIHWLVRPASLALFTHTNTHTHTHTHTRVYVNDLGRLGEIDVQDDACVAELLGAEAHVQQPVCHCWSALEEPQPDPLRLV
jgi:hypothetical protein